MRQVPKIIEEVGFDFDWSNEKVWNLDIPVEEISISELEWHFEIPFWNSPNGYYDLSPNQVLENKEKFKDEFRRILNADTSHPIDIMENKSRWLILDGLHRLVKLKLEGKREILVRKIPRTKIPDISSRKNS